MEDIKDLEAFEDSQVIASAVDVNQLHEAFKKLNNNLSGIYLFKNLINGKCYVGQSIKLKSRLLSHLGNYLNKRYGNPLYRAFNKYGLENFKVIQLCTIDNNDKEYAHNLLDQLEIYFIQKYNSYSPNGYNQTLGGDGGVTGYKFTQQQLKKHSENGRRVQNDGRNKVYCYDITTDIVTEYSSITNLCEKLNVTISHGNIRNTLIYKRFILGRTLQELSFKKSKIKNYLDFNGNIDSTYWNSNSKFTVEMKNDILNNISESEFLLKYNVCRKTFWNYKKALGLNNGRIYTRRVFLEDFVKAYKTLQDISDCAKYFNETKDYIYRIRKEAQNKGLL